MNMRRVHDIFDTITNTLTVEECKKLVELLNDEVEEV